MDSSSCDPGPDPRKELTRRGTGGLDDARKRASRLSVQVKIRDQFSRVDRFQRPWITGNCERPLPLFYLYPSFADFLYITAALCSSKEFLFLNI